ncbi:MAG: hypothetical protein FJ271_11850 [Planctomycetes bacterium]|nr:hypothetical protein [Planctomycetota bacterium]
MPDLITRERAIRNLNNLSATAAENQMLDALIAGISTAVQKHCRREFVARDHDEVHSGNGALRLFLRNDPLISVQSVRQHPATVLRVKNTDTATNQQARISVQSTCLLLVRVASGVVSSSRLTYANHVTLQALATAIAALGNGWTAEVAGSVAGDYGLWPALDLWSPPSYGDGVTSRGALNARAAWAELTIHVGELSSYDFDPRGWLLMTSGSWSCGVNNYRVQYTAGYLHVPEDVQEACAQWVAACFWASKRDPGLSHEAVPGVASRSIIGAMPPGVVELLRPYRRHEV